MVENLPEKKVACYSLEWYAGNNVWSSAGWVFKCLQGQILLIRRI